MAHALISWRHLVLPDVMLGEIISGGFCVSARPATTKPQFMTGPQKCVVLGPVGELIQAFNPVAAMLL